MRGAKCEGEKCLDQKKLVTNILRLHIKLLCFIGDSTYFCFRKPGARSRSAELLISFST